MKKSVSSLSHITRQYEPDNDKQLRALALILCLPVPRSRPIEEAQKRVWSDGAQTSAEEKRKSETEGEKCSGNGEHCTQEGV